MCVLKFVILYFRGDFSIDIEYFYLTVYFCVRGVNFK